ncbi:MAG TPA: amino acid transporter [Actinomycetes bacterium]|nr:amino acid transporter [Actinomycetes bacterium]
MTAAVMEIDAADASRILGQLEAAGLVVWLDGGWGVDALVGSQTRPHRDLDLVIAREDLAAAQETLAAAGFSHYAATVPGLPARLVLVDDAGRQVDLHPVIFDRHGNGWQDLGADAWGDYPAEELTATGVIAGRSVRCKTPTLEVRHRLGYPLSATDRHDLALLARRFGVAVPPSVADLAAGGEPGPRLSDSSG